MTTQKIRIAILGASGYTGAELIRLLLTHPYAEITALTANAHAGQEMAAVFPHLRGADLPKLITIEELQTDALDLVFCCLPHATTQKVIAGLPDYLKIIDLSADFRLRDVAEYKRWYGEVHQAPILQGQAVYGLTEHYRELIPESRLIANPGCYPTCSLLPLIPFAKAGILDVSQVIIDAKSGVSGAGRSIKQNLLFNEVSEGMQPYGVNNHRHIGEITQELTAFADEVANITFVPHLIPQRRGMIATIYVRLQQGININTARQILEKAYKDESFVHVLPEGEVPSTHSVRASNYCHMNLFAGSSSDDIILISAIDNLMKGASGQAVQNMNLLYGWEETLGLAGGAIFP
jgi:N-acetyl-gamma-glutamyl-phosphate reductase